MKNAFYLSNSFRLIAGLLLLFAVQLVHAEDYEKGMVKIWVNKGFVRVYNAAPVANGTARCTGGTIGGMVLDITTDYGKAIFSKLLAAEAAGQSVTFFYIYSSTNYMCELTAVASP